MTDQSRNKWIWKLPFLVILIVGTILIIRRHADAPYQKDSGSIFGTFYHITYQSNQNFREDIEAELKKVDASLSPFNQESIISAINNNTSMKVNDMFKLVFETAMRISEETDGDFDITVSPLVNLWGFGFKNDIKPDSAVVDSLKQFVGYQTVKLINSTIHKADERTMLDCSSIAKGFGVDVIAALLMRNGVENFMVEIGGEVVTRGMSHRKEPWRIGISKPVDELIPTVQEPQQILLLHNEAMATSGNYRNFRVEDGKKYAHTINPHTGYPVDHNLLSATVIAKDCMTADGYATAFMVMGLEKTKLFLEQHPELEVYLIYSDDNGENQVFSTPSLADKFGK
ncbi:MAG: FAD:protein FMN transferase [Bacteroidaceae bacterium]|nr:FAD:protein FMN transferase [Bacteroidaceae bacterium]